MSRVLIISPNTVSDPYPVYPIGMAIVSAALAGSGHEVRQYDLLVEGQSEDRLKEAISGFDPHYVGVSLRNIDTVDSCDPENSWFLSSNLDLIRTIRKATAAPVIIGGPAFSIMPDEILGYLGADYGVVGEGEHTVCGLIEGLDGKKPMPRITGSVVRNGDTRTAAVYSPCWEKNMVDFYRQESGMMNILTKRGCPYGCAYCTYPAIEGHTIRHRPPDDVADEMEKLKTDYGVDTFYFTDSVFNDEEGGYLKVAETIVRREMNIRWTAFFRPARMSGEEWSLLKRSGLYAIELGSDASNDAALQGLNKQFGFDDIYDFNEAAMKNRMPCAHYIIFGGPDETDASVDEGLRNLERLRNCMVLAFSGIRVLPSTPLLSRAVREGIVAEGASLLEPVYYFSPGMDAEKMNGTIVNSFRGRINRIFPPFEGLSRMRKLHEVGYRGLMWDRLVRFG